MGPLALSGHGRAAPPRATAGSSGVPGLVGSRVTVRYLPEHPEALPADTDRSGSAIGFVVCVVALVLFGLVGLIAAAATVSTVLDIN
ncbi:hypothetical protein ACFYS8_01810 [Kitasatospora sp. NPDC004615]|uniref:hypothetical protein n=1 Tax=Kitasatospora sp. NPDC004615 TaxID=3364017 RepID=UPI0036C69D01